MDFPDDHWESEIYYGTRQLTMNLKLIGEIQCNYAAFYYSKSYWKQGVLTGKQD